MVYESSRKLLRKSHYLHFDNKKKTSRNWSPCNHRSKQPSLSISSLSQNTCVFVIKKRRDQQYPHESCQENLIVKGNQWTTGMNRPFMPGHLWVCKSNGANGRAFIGSILVNGLAGKKLFGRWPINADCHT